MYKKYIVKKGRKIGPYYYKAVRLKDGRVKSVYLGRSPQEPESSRRHSTFDNSAVAAAMIFIILGMFLFNNYDFWEMPSFFKTSFSFGSSNLITGAATTELGLLANTTNDTISNQSSGILQNETIFISQTIDVSVNQSATADTDYILRLPDGTTGTAILISGYVEGDGDVSVLVDGKSIFSWSYLDNATANQSYLPVEEKPAHKKTQTNESGTQRYSFKESCAGDCSFNFTKSAVIHVSITGSATLFIEALHVNVSSISQITDKDVTVERKTTIKAAKPAKQERRKERGGAAMGILKFIEAGAVQGRKVRRGPDWAESCGAGGCAMTLFSSPVNMLDSDGEYKPLSQVVSFSKIDERTINLKWRDYDVNITLGAEGLTGLTNVSLEVIDELVDYEFIYRYNLSSTAIRPYISVESSKNVDYDKKNVYIGDLVVSFEDAEDFNNFNVSTERVNDKHARAILSKDYLQQNYRIGDQVEIDPTIRLKDAANNTYDGYVYDAIYAAEKIMIIGINCDAVGSGRGFIDWNTTLIPDNARVISINLTLYLENQLPEEPTVRIAAMDKAAAGRTYTEIAVDAFTGQFYTGFNAVAGTSISTILGYAANLNMEKNLSINNFTLGFSTAEQAFCDTGGVNQAATSEGVTVANRPLLTVNYNLPPNVTVVVNSTDITKNDTNQNLSIVFTSASDPDSDSFTNITDWRRNGTSITVINTPFDTNTTSTTSGAVRSYSSFAYNGTLGSGVAANVPQWNNSCIRGGCYSFDGSNDFINFTTNIVLGNEFTIVAWILPYNYSNIEEIAANSAGGSSTDGFRFDLNDWQTNNRRIILETGNGVTGNNAQTNTGIAGFSVWNHVAVVVNRTAGTARIYVNGTDVTSDQTILTNFAINRSIQVGIMSDLNFPFKGSIDEFQIYNRSLSSGQIALLYSNSTTIHNSTIGSEIGNLFSACVTPNDLLGDGTTTCSNNLTILAVATATETTYSPNATLYKPNNATIFRDVGNITLNGTVTDDNGDRMKFVRMYASRYLYPNGTWLVQEWLDVLNGPSLQYNIPSVPIQDDDPQSSGALLIFHFDNQSDYGEPQFGRVYDFSGNNLNATANSNIYPRRGKMGGGLDVNSNSLGANVSNTEYLIGKKNITYLAWVNTSTLSPLGYARVIFDKWDLATGFGFSVRQQKLSSNLQLFFDAITVTVSSFFTAANVWHHLAVVLHAAGTFEVYRDGILFTNGTYSSITANNNPFSIGSRYDGTQHLNDFPGTIDDVAVFNRSLSAEEIMNIAKLKSGTYYWYLNMTDNSTSALNGGSPVRTFIVNRYPNITNFSLTPSPANTTNQLACTFKILDDETSAMTADINFYNGTRLAETYVGGSFNNGTVYTQAATSGLQAKGESWSCGVTNIADSIYLTHGSWDGANSTPVTIVNTPPSQPVLLEPAHGNVTTNIRPRFRWTASDADNDSLNFTLQLTCYNGTSLAKCPLGGDDRNITLINANSTYLTADLRFYKDDNFYYNWTVNVTDGDNATNFTMPNNLSEVVVVDISMNILNVSFGTKVLNDQDDTLDNSPYPLKIRNGGNAKINLDLLFGPSDLLFTQSDRPAWSYQFAVNETNDCGPSTTCASPVFHYNAINKTLSTTTLTNVIQGVYTSVVKFLNFSASSNLTALHFNITVPPSETAGDKRSLFTLTASYGGYI